MLWWRTKGLSGNTVVRLVIEAGMSRRWIYYRLQGLAESDHAVQVSRGLWRAAVEGADGA
ncbi:MAG TPA: hypothetical protein VHZ03_23160 [Trebonia sp.]|nr:hypothetical protein [Trebonia sp.]